MTITGEDLMGKPLGKNQFGNMTYAKGLIETYLPGEFQYHEDGSEGPFLASLCLYLLSQKKAPSPLFDANDRIFLEHFVFHNIPKEKFLAEMAKHPDEQTKVKTILGLIKSDINKTKRFHDFYINGYKGCQFTTEQQAIFYCQQLLIIFNKDLAKAKDPSKFSWIPPYSWEKFIASCQEHDIIIPDLSTPVKKTDANKPSSQKPGSTLPAINELLSNYIKDRQGVVDSTGKTKEYFHSIFTSLQKSYTQKSKAVLALQQALEGENVDLTAHLATLRDGNLGKQLRAFIKSGNANELVGKDVNTVSAFVTALQDKNSGHNHTL